MHHTIEGARVVRVRPRADRVLTACEGRLWVTLPGRRGEGRAAGSDHVLVPGDRLLLRGGQSAVISSGPRGTRSTFRVEATARPQGLRAMPAVMPAMQALMMSVLGWRHAR
jgi:hypothetical protein